MVVLNDVHEVRSRIPGDPDEGLQLLDADLFRADLRRGANLDVLCGHRRERDLEADIKSIVRGQGPRMYGPGLAVITDVDSPGQREERARFRAR